MLQSSRASAESLNNRAGFEQDMGEENERFQRIVRTQDDEFIITPPKVLLDEAERLGQDPRRPRTAVARWASSHWAESRREVIRRSEGDISLDAAPADKELMERPQHYPSDFGLSLIPFPNEVGGWVLDKTVTTCYTSLSTPRPFDPHLHSSTLPDTVGFGYHYQGGSPFMDKYDIIHRRGGGPRGGFSFTTGPTEGNYPQTILPSPTFNLGELGFSDGGWNPEGLQYTNRPRQMRLSGLRNSWPHRVFFVRSRQVFFRNLYGPIAVDEATPRAPSVVLNGSQSIHGVLSISSSHKLNTPQVMTIKISSVAGRRAGIGAIGDTVQVFTAPRQWANPPLVFTGYISDIEETGNDVTLTCLDTLGFLTNETLLENPSIVGDASSVIKSIIAKSSYSPPLGRISTRSRVVVPTGLDLKGKTRLAAVQSVLGLINNTPRPMVIYSDEKGYIHLREMREVDDSTVYPLVAGRLPRTDQPQDFYPTTVERVSGDLDVFNVVTVVNETAGVNVTVPSPTQADFPQRPVHRVVHESTVQDDRQAEMFAGLMLQNIGRTRESYTVEGIPERFDIMAGDVMEFATAAGIAGRHRVFSVSWTLSPAGATMMLNVGRQSPNLVSTLRFANEVSL